MLCIEVAFKKQNFYFGELKRTCVHILHKSLSSLDSYGARGSWEGKPFQKTKQP